MSNIILYIFPGPLEVAQIAGDLNLEDVSCPYCESSESCEHLLACIDPLNYSLGGRFEGLDQEFVYRIQKAFLPYLKEGHSGPDWKSEEISELWDWAQSNWSAGDEEIAMDEVVLFRLMSELLTEAAEHADFGSELEGYGHETEYCIIYDDNPERVLGRTIRSLDKLLTP